MVDRLSGGLGQVLALSVAAKVEKHSLVSRPTPHVAGSQRKNLHNETRSDHPLSLTFTAGSLPEVQGPLPLAAEGFGRRALGRG